MTEPGAPQALRAVSRVPSEVRVRLNGEMRTVRVAPERTLLELLRVELGLTGTKYGCGEGLCGACTVLLDGEAVHACQVALSDLDGRRVVTIEGLARDGSLHPVQRAFAELGAFQCGFCTPGMVVRASALLAQRPRPSDTEILGAMEGNLCRCGGYARILRAIRRASELAQAPNGGAP